MDERMNWISARAYHLWECAGRPEGRNEEHWLQAVAERELMERTRASHDGAEVLARNAVARAATKTKAGRPYTVLVVEDEAFLRFDTVDVLENAGFRTFEAANADEALILLENNKVDILYTDINMPGSMDGLGLANKVLSLWPKTKIIVVSGLVRMTGVHPVKGVSFVAKPVPPDRLLRLVSSRRNAVSSA